MPKPVEEPFDQFQQYYRTPNNRTTTENFQLFLWNREEGAIFGRTPSSWSFSQWELDEPKQVRKMIFV
uniref:Uncharacterized protein n=1 Tax=Anopheles dirus TaxID=7168 RepID=A0A182MZB5_9DIPT